jgi:hypothetical protein
MLKDTLKKSYDPLFVSVFTTWVSKKIRSIYLKYHNASRRRRCASCFCPVHKRIDLIDNHHGVRNPHPSLQDKGSNQSSPVAILSNTSPPTSVVSFGLGGDVFVAQHGHNTNSIT